MASITTYQNASGQRAFRVAFRDVSGKPSTRRFRTKREAAQFAAEVEVSKATGSYVAPALGRVTVGELAPDWLDRKEQGTAKSHYRMLESAWRVHVKPRWASVRLSDIDQLDIEAWVAQMTRDGAGATTVIRCHGVLSGILGDATKSRRLATNPAKNIDNLPRKTTRRHVYLSAADVERLAVEAGEHRALVLTLAFTGVRWGEAVALRVADVEFLRRRLSVHSNAVQLGVDFAVGPTKGRENRSVPVPQFVLDELSVLCRGKAADALVFGDGQTYLPRPKSGRGWFSAAAKRAKVQAVTPHDLRHTAASLAVSVGGNVLAISRMLGHKDPSVTLGTYSDLFDSDLDAVATALDVVREKAIHA